jgi:hypothetical protein
MERPAVNASDLAAETDSTGVSLGLSPTELSAAVGGPTQPFAPNQRLSTLCHFFADQRQMVVVASDHISKDDADLALAWGLAYRGDRQLSVVLPTDRATPTRVRLPWLVPTVRLFVLGSRVITEPLPLTQAQSIRSFVGRNRSGAGPAVLGEMASWVNAVLDWTAATPQVDMVERPKYVAWHVAGRQVLKMFPGSTRLTVIAGVDSTRPENWPEPFKVRLTGQAPENVQRAIIAASAEAATARLAGHDDGHREHRMQASMRPEQLGVETWRREYPAWRPGSARSAFIDFLAIDNRNRPHVVETKIGPDAMLVFQGLDYWLWCKANVDTVATEFAVEKLNEPVIDFVVAPKKPGDDVVSIYTAAQVEALARDINWRFVVVSDPDTATDVQQHPSYHVPSAWRRAADIPPRWAVRLHHHATGRAAQSAVQLVRSHSYPDAATGLVPAALPAFKSLRDRGLLHSHVLHVRSSQAFALNLLAPLSLDAWTELSRHLLDDRDAIVQEPPEFEYSDPADTLAEATRVSPHTTQVDCLLRVRRGNGRVHVLVIEVKLSEDTFSTCSAATSPSNTRTRICQEPGPFGGDAAGCFQLSSHDREHRRRYDTALGPPRAEPNSFGCWFRDGANQVMRNVALAKVMLARGEAATASMVLVAPDDHAAIWEQWHRHTRYLAMYDDITFNDLPASRVAALHDPALAAELCERYLLPAELLAIRRAQRLLDDRFPNGLALVRLETDGSVRYIQALDRLPVRSVSEGHVTFETEYPAGPFSHRVSLASLTGGTGDLVVADDEGDGSRVLTADLEGLEGEDVHVVANLLRRELPSRVGDLRRRQPWWTAPLTSDQSW